MAMSADEHLFTDRTVVLHVFTDREDEVRGMAGDFNRVTVNPISIEALKWPEATLLRYSLIDEHRSDMDQDLLIHLDADMRIVADIGDDLHPNDWPGGLALVRHPGFWRPNWPHRLSLYARNPRLATQDAILRAQSGSRGAWEQRPESRAYVPRNERRVYVCGGTWMGLRDPFLSMVHELSERTKADLIEGTIAVWHDESHMNWYSSQHPTALLSSEYCFAQGFANLAGLDPKILAVDKGDERTR